jgi:hypothetical protein
MNKFEEFKSIINKTPKLPFDESGNIELYSDSQCTTTHSSRLERKTVILISQLNKFNKLLGKFKKKKHKGF